ncbi:hypothetical protein GCM10010228_15590 [Streptomyces massasporeus]|nr:hypothetical protein GCM10010228_15590 [Streptomyces massasporeus]
MVPGRGVTGAGELRSIAAPFVASGPSGVAVRARLKHLTPGEAEVLRLMGGHSGSLASKDLKARCRDGLEHSAEAWAVRKRELTPLSSSRWAGSITKATHDTPPGRGRAHGVRVAWALGGGALVLSGRRRVGQTLRQRDVPHHPRR